MTALKELLKADEARDRDLILERLVRFSFAQAHLTEAHKDGPEATLADVRRFSQDGASGLQDANPGCFIHGFWGASQIGRAHV